MDAEYVILHSILHDVLWKIIDSFILKLLWGNNYSSKHKGEKVIFQKCEHFSNLKWFGTDPDLNATWSNRVQQWFEIY